MPEPDREGPYNRLMDFESEQIFASAVDEVMDAFTDPEFFARLGRLEKIKAPQVVERSIEGGLVRMAIRYQAEVDLSGLVRRFVSEDKLSWIEHSEHDLATGRASFRMQPEHYTSLLQCSGTYLYEPLDEGGSRRIMAGSLHVRVPIGRSRVERVIVDDLQNTAAQAAGLVDEWLQERRSGPD